MKTLLINNAAREKSNMQSGSKSGRNKSVLVSKTETYRSSKDAQDRALQLRDSNVDSVFILQKQIQIFCVRYKLPRYEGVSRPINRI